MTIDRPSSNQPPHVIRLYTANNHFQHAEVLRRNRHKRQHYGEFFLEGVRPINLALAHRWDVEAFLYSPERGLSDWAKNILHTSSARTHFELPPILLDQLSGKTESSELLAIMRMPEDDLSRIPLDSCPCVIVFDRPSSPGNLGSLMRSADALGANGMVVTGHGADVYDPETISASRGSLFALPTVRVPGPREVHAWVQTLSRSAERLQVVAMDEQAEAVIWDTDLTRPTVLLLGNEKWGLSDAFKQMATLAARIPIGGAASSLNVAAAGSIALYEMRRQRSNPSDAPPGKPMSAR
jgi:23S rRNA (uridine2479-2'-O)-methyltransferase